MGETLLIPLDGIADAFLDRPQVHVILYAAADVSHDDIDVVLNGIEGTHLDDPSPSRTSVYFKPFPEEPTALEVRVGQQATLGILLHDFVCEQLNPTPPCPK